MTSLYYSSKNIYYCQYFFHIANKKALIKGFETLFYLSIPLPNNPFVEEDIDLI